VPGTASTSIEDANACSADFVAAVVRPEIRALKALRGGAGDGDDQARCDGESLSSAGGRAREDRRRRRDVSINRYPDGGAANVKAALREAFAIPESFGIVLGNGSDELIQMLTVAVAAPGATILAPDPSFVMYRMNATYAGVRFAGVPLAADFALDSKAMLEAIERERPALIFLAYPNNPTGNLYATRDIEAVIRAAPGLVVVDEAYHAFAGTSFLPRLAEFPNVVVMRTVSKIGMAGLRLGYAIAPPSGPRRSRRSASRTTSTR
jgi:histidinol-phosphate aminotransferase